MDINETRYVVDAPVLVNRNPIITLPGGVSLTLRQLAEWSFLVTLIYFLVTLVALPLFGFQVAAIIVVVFFIAGYAAIQVNFKGLSGTDLLYKRFRYYILNRARHYARSTVVQAKRVLPTINLSFSAVPAASASSRNLPDDKEKQQPLAQSSKQHN